MATTCLPSFNPYSPSYDTCAASPCNPFPTTSPFAAVSSFSPPLSVHSSQSEDSSESDYAPPPPRAPRAPHLAPRPHPALARIPPPHSAPGLRRTKPCRFYISSAGCKAGRWCNFKHPVGAVPESDGDQAGDIAALPAPAVRSAYDLTDPSSLWEDALDVRDLDPDWGKKSDDEVHPKYRTQPCRNYLLGLCRYGDKCQFIHAPGLFVPGTMEVPTSLPVASVTVPISVWGMHPGVGAPSPETSPVRKSEQMSLFYRTKPCKYFGTTGVCPHGEDCKFIHDPKKASHIPAFVPSWADDDRDLDFLEVPFFESVREDSVPALGTPMHDLTNRDRSASEEREHEHNAGIYKPLWRVVGGGVRVGGDARMRDEHVEEDDVVFDYQPCDMGASTRGYTSLVQPVSPMDFTYTPFDPAQYPPHALLRAPSPDAPLDITMGRMDAFSDAPRRRRQPRRVVTGADLMRALDGGEEEGEKDRAAAKPRLTIAVPVRTPDGDDVLDWDEQPEQETAAIEEEFRMRVPPRRTRSTPPTPRSIESYLDVPMLPRPAAESP